MKARKQSRSGWRMAGILMLLVAEAAAAPMTNAVHDPYFLGYEMDPAMDYGGAGILDLQALASRGLASVLPSSYAAPVYEFFLASGLCTVQHEVFGHGARARENGLDPQYAFGLDLSGGTGLREEPQTLAELLAIAGGGTEGDSVLADRALLELYTGAGAEAAKIPLMVFSKIDVSLYSMVTADPADARREFVDDYTNGNDIAYYLVARQAQRQGGTAAAVWNNEYAIDFKDPLLHENYDAVQAAALWNLVDPAMLAALFEYGTAHVGQGQTRVKPPVVPLGGGYGLTAGTRAFLGPAQVDRYLDLLLTTPGPLIRLYAREMDSSLEQTYGFGATLHRLLAGERRWLSLQTDYWREPDSLEKLDAGSGWNFCGELTVMLSETVGVAAKLGGKSDGFNPGTPAAAGVYGGAGLWVVF